MRKLRVVYFKRSHIITALCLIASFIILIFCFVYQEMFPVKTFSDPQSGIIVIDPGHGGIDGGTVKGGILEKEINLDIGRKLKSLLEKRGFTIIMTREKDISLEQKVDSNKSRHVRDLNARTDIINNSNAQLFVSIHVNCNLKKPSTDGAIVFYNLKFEQNKTLAFFVQRSLNSLEINGRRRTVHDPVQARYYVLANSNIPGVLVETAFISNRVERQELAKEVFRENTANAIVHGIEQYLRESTRVSSPGR